MTMRCSALLCALVLSTGAQATTRTWPGAAPCNGTLEACFSASASGDTIVLATDTPIDESIGVNSAVNLVARTGFKPRFAAGRFIAFTPQEAGPWSLLVSGIAFDDGGIAVQMVDDGNVVLEDIAATSMQGTFPIQVGTFMPPSGTIAAQVTVRRCRLRVGTSTGIGIFVSAADGAQLDARVHDNTIEPIGQIAEPASSVGPTGINVRAFGAAAHSIDIQRNRVLPAPDGLSNPLARLATGIVVSTFASTGPSAIRVADNVTVLRPGANFANAGVLAILDGTSNDIRVINNTHVGGRNGIRVQRDNAAANVSGRIDNNLVTLASFVGIFILPRTLEPALGNANNLVFGNAIEEFTPGPGTLTVDPQLVSVARPRLSPASGVGFGSPAINAGDLGRRLSFGPGTLPALPALDNDGLRRVKSGTLDIGAYEFGDDAFLHNTTGFANTTALNDPRVNGSTMRTLLATRSGGRFASDTTPNPRPMSQRYNTGTQRWELLADDGFNINTGAGFTVFVPGTGIGSLTHVTNGTNVAGAFSQLPASPNNAIYLISASRGADSGGIADPHPLGASFQFGNWFAVNLDNAAMPLSSRFNVYWQEPSANAYVHTVEADNQPNALVSELDHPLLNGNRCAVLHVSSNATVSLNPHHVGVRYDSARQRWYVRNEDGAMLPINTQFFVVIDAANSETGCGDALFADGFETEQ
jgi:hypothetical protein